MKHGFTLVEVMVSLFVLSLILLALDAMQWTTLRESQSNSYFAIAANQVNTYRERLRVQKGVDIEVSLFNWNQQNKAVLPNGRGVLQGHYPDYVLHIFWGDQSSGDCQHNQIGKSGCLREVIHL